MFCFASYLLNGFGMRKEGFDYLLKCGEYGKKIVIEHLKIIHLNKSGDELNQIAAYCTASGIGREFALEVHKAKATECVNARDYNRGIDLTIKAGLEDQIDDIFYQMILNFAMTGYMYDLNLLGEQDPASLYHTIYYYLWKMSIAWEQKRFFLGNLVLKQPLNLRAIPSDVCLMVLLEAA